MPQKAIKTELLMETIIPCPKCHKQNRLSKRAGKGVYRCSICQLQLPNPFLSLSEPQAQTSQSGRVSVRRMLSISILAGLGLLVLVLVRSCLSDGQSSSPSSAPIASESKTVPSSALVASESKTVSKQPIAIPKNRSLPSSTVLTSPATSDGGSLQVSNGTSSDAYLKLVDPLSSRLMAAFYVKSNSTFTLKQIPDGVYQALFVSCEDWDAKTRTFTRNASFTRFDHSLSFVTTKQTSGRRIYMRYTIFKVTLNPVVGGTATTSAINKQEFAHY